MNEMIMSNLTRHNVSQWGETVVEQMVKLVVNVPQILALVEVLDYEVLTIGMVR